MSDLTEPLLPNDEFADESPSFHSCRVDSTLYFGRAIYQIQGAANVIKEWPNVSLLKTTWTRVGMIVISVLFVYNFMLALSWSTPNYTKKMYPKLISNSDLPEVFMHIIINSSDEATVIDQFRSVYLEFFSKNYVNYKYNVIVLFNDTLTEETQTSAEINNEIALNSLWTTKHTYWKTEYNNVKITYMPLSRFFADSPLSTEWRYFPEQFIKFLVRAVSLWEKGGIAFNPELLHHSKYQERIENVLRNYKICHKEPNVFLNKIKKSMQKKYPVHNIYEIIQRFINNTDDFTDFEYDQTAAEDNIFQIEDKINVDQVSKSVDMDALTSSKTQVLREEEKVSNKDPYNLQTTRYIKREITTEANDDIRVKFIEKKSKYKQELKSKMNSAQSAFNRVKPTANDPSRKCEVNKLTIEINGNILATRTPCHAFLGNVFSDVVYTRDSKDVSSFITTELSKFCSGILSLCEILK